MSEQKTAPTFLTVAEVAELLRVSERSVYDWVSRGRIPHRKAGGRTIFLLSEVMEWTKPLPPADSAHAGFGRGATQR